MKFSLLYGIFNLQFDDIAIGWIELVILSTTMFEWRKTKKWKTTRRLEHPSAISLIILHLHICFQSNKPQTSNKLQKKPLNWNFCAKIKQIDPSNNFPLFEQYLSPSPPGNNIYLKVSPQAKFFHHVNIIQW